MYTPAFKSKASAPSPLQGNTNNELAADAVDLFILSALFSYISARNATTYSNERPVLCWRDRALRVHVQDSCGAAAR